jgi:hypothetical protein
MSNRPKSTGFRRCCRNDANRRRLGVNTQGSIDAIRHQLSCGGVRPPGTGSVSKMRPSQSSDSRITMSLTPVSPGAFGLLISSLAMSAVMAQSVAESSPAITDPEAYAVYAAVLPRSVLHENHPEPIAIQLETFPGPADCPRAELITDEWRAAVDDYRRQNAVTRFIRPGFNLGKKYSLVPWGELRQMLTDEGYMGRDAPSTNAPGARVFAHFPGGAVVVLSTVGFNPERTRAMVSVQRNCILKDGDVGCEAVHTVGLRKKDGRWDPSGIGCHGIA